MKPALVDNRTIESHFIIADTSNTKEFGIPWVDEKAKARLSKFIINLMGERIKGVRISSPGMAPAKCHYDFKAYEGSDLIVKVLGHYGFIVENFTRENVDKYNAERMINTYEISYPKPQE